MKARNLFFGLMAGALFCACSSEDELTTNSSGTSGSEVAYMRVQLNDVGAGTRATSLDGEAGLSAGSSAEHTISSAYFYFFNSDGRFVTSATATPTTASEAGEGDAVNIEMQTTQVILLDNLTEATYPKYMVTVLNRSDFDFTSGTLSELQTKLSSTAASDEGIYNNTGSTFVMSTSSYYQDDNNTGYYFVNELTDNNFVKTTDQIADANIVNVYVERLAAKVTVDVADGIEKVADNVYAIGVTNATYENDEATGISPTEGTVYVKINGWKLNAKTKKSYMMKNLESSWTDTFLGFDWNDATLYRSYWGKSYNYGLADTEANYPASSTEFYTEDNATNTYLTYVNLNNPTALGSYEYCAENTNTGDKVTENFPGCLTSVLVSAQMCDENGNAIDYNLISYGGLLYQEADFVRYVLNDVQNDGLLNAYTRTGSGTEGDEYVYTQITTDNVSLDYTYDGQVYVTLNSGLTLYSDTQGTTFTTTDEETLNANFKAAAEEANGYKTGLMYYNIPIEHLNNNEPTVVGSVTSYNQGNYGVVRNHYYNITIDGVTSLGKGIYNPDELIVPVEDELERYKLAARINVLSWKIVSQSVTL